MHINKKIEELIIELKQTREFKELKKTHDNINKNKNLKKQVDGFQNRQKQIYSMKKSANVVQKEIEDLNRTFEDLAKIPEVDAFLKSGKAFNDLIANIFKNINDSINSELK